MGKFLFIIVFTFSVSLIAQKYSFDKVITVEYKIQNGDISNRQNLINSKSNNYALFLKDESTAELWDRVSKIRHFFTVQFETNGQILFKYVRSCDESEYFIQENSDSEHDFRVERINNKEFMLNEFRSKKTKKPLSSISIYIEESTENNLEILHELRSDYKEKLSEYLDEEKNYKTVKMKFHKTGFELKLNEMVDYSIEIKLPNKLNFKCLNPIPDLIK